MEGRCEKCGRVYEISDDFLAMGGRAKCPHCLINLHFDKSAPGRPAGNDDRFWEATKPDSRRRAQPRASAPAGDGEIDARCASCQRHYKVDSKYLQAGGEALCPHCNVELELLQDVDIPGRVAQPSAAAPAGELDWQESVDEQEDLDELESAFEEPVDEAAEELDVGDRDAGQAPEAEDDFAAGPAAEPVPQPEPQPEPGPEAGELWSAAARIDLPELEQLRERTGEQSAEGAEGQDPWQAPDEEQLAEEDDAQAWQPAGDGDEALERQETDVWQAPQQPGAEVAPEAGLDGELSGEETVTTGDMVERQAAPAGDDFADEVFASEDEDWPEQADATSAPVPGPDDPYHDADDLQGQQFRQEREADMVLDLESPVDEPAAPAMAAADASLEPDEVPAGSAEAGAQDAVEPEAEPEPGPSQDMETLFDDVSMEGAAAEPLDTGQLGSDELRQPALADEREAPAGDEAEPSQADNDQWPADETGEQEPVGQEAAGRDLLPAAAGGLDLDDDSGSLPGQGSADDWAAAAARWAESGFNPDDIPDFMAPGDAEGQEPAPGEDEKEPEEQQPESPAVPAPVDDTGTVEVSDADILMVDDSEVEPITDGPTEQPEVESGRAEHWAQRASRELAARRRESQAAGSEARKAFLARSLSNPFVAGGVGLAVIVIVVAVWWLLAGSENVDAVAFPLGRCRQAHLVEGPAPSAYQGRRSAVEHYALGNRLAYHGKFEDAVLEYKQAIRLDPGFPHPHRALGAMYAALGSKGLSAIEYETYLRLAPDTGDADQVRRVIAASRK